MISDNKRIKYDDDVIEKLRPRETKIPEKRQKMPLQTVSRPKRREGRGEKRKEVEEKEEEEKRKGKRERERRHRERSHKKNNTKKRPGDTEAMRQIPTVVKNPENPTVCTGRLESCPD